MAEGETVGRIFPFFFWWVAEIFAVYLSNSIRTLVIRRPPAPKQEENIWFHGSFDRYTIEGNLTTEDGNASEIQPLI